MKLDGAADVSKGIKLGRCRGCERTPRGRFAMVDHIIGSCDDTSDNLPILDRGLGNLFLSGIDLDTTLVPTTAKVEHPPVDPGDAVETGRIVMPVLLFCTAEQAKPVSWILRVDESARLIKTDSSYERCSRRSMRRLPECSTWSNRRMVPTTIAEANEDYPTTRGSRPILSGPPSKTVVNGLSSNKAGTTGFSKTSSPLPIGKAPMTRPSPSSATNASPASNYQDLELFHRHSIRGIASGYDISTHGRYTPRYLLLNPMSSTPYIMGRRRS